MLGGVFGPEPNKYATWLLVSTPALAFRGAGGMSNNIPKNPEALARWTRMADLFRGGHTVQEIADKFGVSKQRVGKCLSILGVTRRDGGKHLRAMKNERERSVARDMRYLARHGCTYKQYMSVRGHATHLYNVQRVNAAQRGVEWGFNFWEWWQVWERSGKWRFRGRGQGWVMCRKGDVGPYSVSNVFIAPARHNTSESNHKKSDMPIGVIARKLSFAAIRFINNKRHYRGGFETSEGAHAEYLRWGGVLVNAGD